jgi:hypothetical protein
MKNKIEIHIDSCEQHESIPDAQFQYCPKCGKECTQSFGLAGGGYGVYSYCEDHGVVGKIQIDE